tara:strand:+ start:556 stop:1149 length:594 start_codon:yes stop_codon:yes gene_type:complete
MKKNFRKEVVFFGLIIFSFFVFSLLFNSKINKNKNYIAVLTSLPFIDTIFEKIISYIEPSSIDQFSYNPKKINLLINSVNDLYGVDLLNNSSDQLCHEKFFRTSRINTCISKNYWKSLSREKWGMISKKYNIEYLVTEEKIKNLKLCSIYDISHLIISKYSLDENKKINLIYQYTLSDKKNASENCKNFKLKIPNIH